MKSKYISYNEMIKNNHGIINEPTPEQLNNILSLCCNCLDKIREYFNREIITSSIFRNEVLNIKVGGSRTSHHLAFKGYAAADIITVKGKTLKQVFDYIKDNLDFAQLIWEFGDAENPDWVHVSQSVNKNDNKKQVLVSVKVNGKTKYFNYV